MDLHKDVDDDDDELDPSPKTLEHESNTLPDDCESEIGLFDESPMELFGYFESEIRLFDFFKSSIVFCCCSTSPRTNSSSARTDFRSTCKFTMSALLCKDCCLSTIFTSFSSCRCCRSCCCSC